MEPINDNGKTYRGGIKKIDGINKGKILEKGWSKTKKVEKTCTKFN
jgi:hypothetical protein